MKIAIFVIFLTFIILGCATQTNATVMPQFTTENCKECARNCQMIYAQCNEACSQMVGGATTARQREQCLNNWNQILKDCYWSCE